MMQFKKYSGATVTELRWGQGYCKCIVDCDRREAFVFFDDKKPEDVRKMYPDMEQNIEKGDEVLIWLKEQSGSYPDTYIANFADYALQPASTKQLWIERGKAKEVPPSPNPPPPTTYKMKTISATVPEGVHAIFWHAWKQRQIAMGKNYHFGTDYMCDVLTQLAGTLPNDDPL
jgi:hypothetical protein